MKYIKKELLKDFCIVTLNRPEVRNAFHPLMVEEITDVFQQINRDEKIKAVIFKGEGTAFCAGADLSWMKDMINYTVDENKLDSEKLWDMFESIQNCMCPIIGIAHGAVFGGALGLLACCDYVYAEHKTQFCFSEVKLGLIPAVISGFILRKCPEAYVRPYMLSADIFNTTSAIHMGLVHSSYENILDIEVIVDKWSINGTQAMRSMKDLLSHKETVLSQVDFKNHATQAISERRVSKEAQIRLKKFLEKK